MKLGNIVFSAVAALVGLSGPVLDAQTRSQGLLPGEQQHAKRLRLTLPPSPPLDPPSAWKTSVLTQTPVESSQQQTPSRKCRRGRRTWIGALIGAGAAAPLAKLAYERWENEAANGAAAAATTVALGAAAGAFIGLSTCQ